MRDESTDIRAAWLTVARAALAARREGGGDVMPEPGCTHGHGLSPASATCPWCHLELVRRMREAQRRYYRTRDREALIESKQLEREVDQALTKETP